MTSKALAARVSGKMMPWKLEIGILVTAYDKDLGSSRECDIIDVDTSPMDSFQVVSVKA